MLELASERIFVPLTVGGGIRAYVVRALYYSKSPAVSLYEMMLSRVSLTGGGQPLGSFIQPIC